MDFSLDDTQQAVADLAATVLRAPEPDEARIAHAVQAELGYDEPLWKAMAQSGLLALAVPADLGGDGFGPVELACVLREVGRQPLPVPALATLALGVLPILAAGNPDQRAVLAEVAHGRILTAALRTLSAHTDEAGAVVDGVAPGVPYAAQAHRILVPTDHGIALIAPDAGGVSLVRTPSATGAPEYTLRCEQVRVDRADILAADPRVLHRAAIVGAAAVADGVIGAALDLTAAHLRSRHQFGKPLATFQAVAQQIADVYVIARTMNIVATSASWRLAAAGVADADPGYADSADNDIDVAAYWLAAEVPPALQQCHHLHGGLGVDITYPLHRYFSQAKDLARLVGGPAACLDAIGARCSSI